MAAKSYVTSQHGGGGGRGVGGAMRHVSPSHFSWPGASFELQAGLGDDEEGRSSGGTQGAAEPTSPSLPSSTSTATNACTRPPPLISATNDDVTPSNGDADTEIADVTAVVCADNGDVIAGDDVKSDHQHEETGRRRRRSCEFNLLDDDDSWAERRDDDVTEEWAWSTRSDWADVICVTDDNEVTPTTATAITTTTTTTTTTTADDEDDDDDDDDVRDDVTQTAINETVMKCIESCDKVLLRHSTAIR